MNVSTEKVLPDDFDFITEAAGQRNIAIAQAGRLFMRKHESGMKKNNLFLQFVQSFG